MVKKKYAIHEATLRRWALQGKIGNSQMPGGKMLYNIHDVDELLGQKTQREPLRVAICYARVSSEKQKADLERQKEDLHRDYPDHEVISDIGSGLNWKRRGFRSILDRVSKRSVSKVVVAHKDRLCRFAFELVEWFFKSYGTEIVVHGRGESGTEELAEDLLSVVNVFVARNNGRRAAENRRKRNGAKSTKNSRLSEPRAEVDARPMARNDSLDVQSMPRIDQEQDLSKKSDSIESGSSEESNAGTERLRLGTSDSIRRKRRRGERSSSGIRDQPEKRRKIRDEISRQEEEEGQLSIGTQTLESEGQQAGDLQEDLSA
jgi:putative resolvase